MYTYEDYLDRIAEFRRERPYQREGQAAFNVLFNMRPWLAHWIQFKTDLDPYHLNSDSEDDRIKLEEFFECVEFNWETN